MHVYTCLCASGTDVRRSQVMAEGDDLNGPSAAMSAFDSMRNVATINFNDPKAAVVDGPEYTLAAVTNLRNTLESVKADIAKCEHRRVVAGCVFVCHCSAAVAS